MDTVLVTGGAGFIGSHLAERLAANHRVVVVDNLLTGSRSNVAAGVAFVKGDVNHYNDIAPLFYRHEFRYVFHFAAVVGVKRTLQLPLRVLEDIEGMKNVLHLSKSTGVERVFYSSSSEVYGEPVNIPQNEQTTPLNSRLPYAIVKNVCEAYLRSYQKEYGLGYTVFRLFNTYGPRQSEDFVVSRFIRQALAGTDITLYGDGRQTRTFNYVGNTVRACVNAAGASRAANNTMNIGSDSEVSVLALAETIKRLCSSQSRITHLPKLEEGDMSRRQPDVTQMRGMLVDFDEVGLEEGLKRTIEYFRERGAGGPAPAAA